MSDLLTRRRMSSVIHILVIAALTKLAWRGLIGDFNVTVSRYLDYNVGKIQANSYYTALNLEKWVQKTSSLFLPFTYLLLRCSVYLNSSFFYAQVYTLWASQIIKRKWAVGGADTCRVHERPHLFTHHWTITSTCWFYLPRRHVSNRTLARIPS